MKNSKIVTYTKIASCDSNLKASSVGGKILSVVTKKGIELDALLTKIYKIEDLAPRSKKYSLGGDTRERYVIEYLDYLVRKNYLGREEKKNLA